MKILVVEDNEGDFILVEDYLHDVFKDAIITHNKYIYQAVVSLNTVNFDVILLDLTLPDSEGATTIKNVISLAGSTPVIVLTGLNDKQVGIESLKLGVQDYLVKSEVNPITIFKSITYSISRKKSEEQLKLSEEKYRDFFNNNPESIFIWESTGLQIMDVNDTAIKKFGIKREDFLALSIMNLAPHNYHLNNSKIFTEKIQLAKQGSSDVTWQHRKKNGELMYLRFSLHDIEYDEQQCILAMGSDVTDKVMLEKQLAEEQQKKQQEITEAVITAQEKERRQLANELHDNINQLLATSRLYIECAISNETLRPKLLEDSKGYISTAIMELRKLSKTLLPPSLGEVGLQDALKDLIEGIRRVNDINFVTDWASYTETDTNDKLKLSIFRIVQEQLNNILKHAEAKNVIITINQEPGEIELKIQDDGVGFDTTQKPDGVGLQNIAARAEVHNGRFEIDSIPGHGCTISICFPLVVGALTM